MNYIWGDNKEALSHISEYDVVSFDIFDTLLIRSFSEPTDLFRYMEEKYSAPGFFECRVNSENELRKNMVGTEEVLLSEIYDRMPTYADLMQKEIDEEISCVHVNMKIMPLYEEAVRLGKTITIISDIYLPELVIEKMLKKNGIKYNRLFVSSTIGKEKWTGNLFRHALSELGVAPNKMIHIGDNYNSDIIAADSLGISTIYSKKIIEDYYDDYGYRKDYTNHDWKRSVLMMNVVEEHQNMDDYWYKFGYEFAGPIYYSFSKWILDVIEKTDSVSDVFFIARDGYAIKDIFDKMNHMCTVKSHYVYAPRIMNLVCRLDYDTEYYDYKSQLKAILSYFSKDIVGYDDNTDNIEELEKIMDNNADIIRSLSEKEHNTYKKYLSTLNYGDGKIVMIDTITDKYSAQKLIVNSVPNEVIGLYWFILEEAVAKKGDMGVITYQKEHRRTLSSWDLMEFILTSPEPSVHTVGVDGPKYNVANSFEEKRVEIFNKIYSGAMKYIDRLLDKQFFGCNIDNESVTKWINDYLANPNEEDIRRFEEVYFSVLPDHSDLNQLKPFLTKTEENKRSRRETFYEYLRKYPKLYHFLSICYRPVKKILGKK